jgi:hypothetical protein
MIVDLLVTKGRIIWPNAAQIKEWAEILREVQSQTGQTKRLSNTTTPRKFPRFNDDPSSVTDNDESKFHNNPDD